jgi:hypothetical protein
MITLEQKEKMIDIILNNEFEWDAQEIIEKWEKKLEDMGFTYPKILYSGFYSQGDGASFTSDFIQLDKYMKYNKLGNKYRALYNKVKAGYFEAKVYRTSCHYVHEKTVELSWECMDKVPDKVMWQMEDDLEYLLKEDIIDISRSIYRELERLYKALTSDSYVEERIKDLEE